MLGEKMSNDDCNPRSLIEVPAMHLNLSNFQALDRCFVSIVVVLLVVLVSVGDDDGGDKRSLQESLMNMGVMDRVQLMHCYHVKCWKITKHQDSWDSTLCVDRTQGTVDHYETR